jgi:hypothetical protein
MMAFLTPPLLEVGMIGVDGTEVGAWSTYLSLASCEVAARQFPIARLMCNNAVAVLAARNMKQGAAMLS